MTMTVEQIADDILGKWTFATREEFKNTKFEDLIRYHHGFGTAIRNEYKLWERKWTPEVRNGVDYSPEHPDQISQTIIETMWKKLHD